MSGFDCLVYHVPTNVGRFLRLSVPWLPHLYLDNYTQFIELQCCGED